MQIRHPKKVIPTITIFNMFCLSKMDRLWACSYLIGLKQIFILLNCPKTYRPAMLIHPGQGGPLFGQYQGSAAVPTSAPAATMASAWTSLFNIELKIGQKNNTIDLLKADFVLGTEKGLDSSPVPSKLQHRQQGCRCWQSKEPPRFAEKALKSHFKQQFGMDGWMGLEMV